MLSYYLSSLRVCKVSVRSIVKSGCDAARRNTYVVDKALLYAQSFCVANYLSCISFLFVSILLRVRHLARVERARCLRSYLLCSDVVSDWWRCVT